MEWSSYTQYQGLQFQSLRLRIPVCEFNSISTLSRSTLCDKVCKTFANFNSRSRYFPHLQLDQSKGLTTHMRKLFSYSNFTCFDQLDSAFATYTSPVARNCTCFTFTTRRPRAGGKPSGGTRRWPRHITPQYKFTFLVLNFQKIALSMPWTN
jgi:hypothetical protein